MFASPVGAKIPSSELLKQHFPNFQTVVNLHGMTECGTDISASQTADNIGHVAPGVEVKIVDPSTGNALGPNATREIMARCNKLMYVVGYLNRPEENAKFFGDDGFIHTGDFGHYDDNLTLFHDGRMNEVIKFENKHVYSGEIEDTIATHPDVLEVGVFGQPDPLVQELVTAAVVLKKNSSLTEPNIVKMVEDEMDPHAWLRGGVTLVDALPKNPQGKILRRELFRLIKIWTCAHSWSHHV